MDAINFIPLMLTTLALAIASFSVRKKKNLPWLIIAFIVWLITFLYTIGVFNR